MVAAATASGACRVMVVPAAVSVLVTVPPVARDCSALYVSDTDDAVVAPKDVAVMLAWPVVAAETVAVASPPLFWCEKVVQRKKRLQPSYVYW